MITSDDIRKVAKEIDSAIKEAEKQSSPETLIKSFRGRFRNKHRKMGGGVAPATPLKLAPPKVKTPGSAGSTSMPKVN